MVFKCVECGYEGDKFYVMLDGCSRGSLTYVAKCPRCGSRKVNTVSGYYIDELRIGLLAQKRGPGVQIPGPLVIYRS